MKSTIWMILFFLMPLFKGYAQLGVTSELFEQIENRVILQFGDYYELDHVISVDSEKVYTRFPGAKIDRSDQSLKGAYIFTVVGKKIDIFTAHNGFIGIYKNNQILWHSDTIINNDDARDPFIEAVMDLNNDGKIEIVTNWSVESGRGGPDYLWIFSWDGSNASLLNDVNNEGQSAIISVSEYYNMIDVNGDGIMEITGAWSDDPEVVHYTENKVVYSWNGQKYGKWSNPPQPPANGILPRNKLTVEFGVTIKKIANEFLYHYSISNSKSSLQSADDFLLTPANAKSASILTGRKEWKPSPGSTTVRWTNMYWYGDANYISPGEKDTSFSIQRGGVPQIGNYYVQGHNGYEYNGYQILTNSSNGFTLTPADAPDPFIPITFLDTLISYVRQSRTIGWIDNDGIANSLTQKLESSKQQLQKGNTNPAKNAIQAFINEVEAQNEKHLTSEAYALLKYNAEYLLEKLGGK